MYFYATFLFSCMRYIVLLLLLCFFNTIHGKEWSSLRNYQKATNNKALTASDWLKYDRKHNTLIWQKANTYNLKHNLYQEYENIVQRRDFYRWMHFKLQSKGHEVVWPAMAYLISKKLHLVEVFPYNAFAKKKIKIYAVEGSAVVFKNAFKKLSEINSSKTIFKGDDALKWDKAILYEEQYSWLEKIYSTVDQKTLKTISRIAKGQFLYSLVVPKPIRFKGNISIAEDRYNYGLYTLREYCKMKKIN